MAYINSNKELNDSCSTYYNKKKIFVFKINQTSLLADTNLLTNNLLKCNLFKKLFI